MAMALQASLLSRCNYSRRNMRTSYLTAPGGSSWRRAECRHGGRAARGATAAAAAAASGAGGGAAPEAGKSAAAAPPAAAGGEAAAVYAMNGAIEPALAPFAAQIGLERRFKCTECGKCCTGSGSVWVSEREAVKIATHLNMGLSKFEERFTTYNKIPGWYLLRNDPNSGEARNCIFLQPDNKCAIHAVRPIQCSTYPWWPELMDQKAWETEKQNICEGFDHPDAPETDLAAAAAQLRTATAHNIQRRLASPGPKKPKGGGGGGKKGAAAAPSLPPLPGGIDPLNPPQLP